MDANDSGFAPPLSHPLTRPADQNPSTREKGIPGIRSQTYAKSLNS